MDLCELENAPERKKCPKTFVHDCRPTGEELSSIYNGEEKSLGHVAMVAKFLDYNKPKIH